MDRKQARGDECADDEGQLLSNVEFVNMNPASQAEKEMNQRVVRSVAMRSYRQKQQSQRRKDEEAKKKNRSRPVEPRTKSKGGSHSEENSQISSLNNAWASEDDLSDTSWLLTLENAIPPGGYTNFESTFGETPPSSNLSDLRSRAFAQPISPITPLGAGRIDPFGIFSLESKPYLHELIDHSVTQIWPGFRVRGRHGRELPSEWLAKTYQRPITMHALLFGAAVHMDVLRRPRINLDNPIRLYHKVQTMRLLEAELRRPDKMPLDDVILAVLALGTNEVETMVNNARYQARSPFNSPMSSAQWLDVYGSMTSVPAHVFAMRSLVRRRGGLEKIELHGLAAILSLSDILGATQHLSKPYWPLLRRTEVTDDSHNFPPGKLGQGFEKLLSFGINKDMANVLRSMVELTRIIDFHCRGVTSILDLGVFIEQRNTLEHSLMSLATGDELKYGEISSVCLYESIRHTAIIFSIAVTFPMPPISGIFRKVAGELRDILEKSKLDPCWQLCSKTLLWMLILGGIAASGTSDRAWYVRDLVALSEALNLTEWEDAALETENYLWLESACDAGGNSLWNEVKSARDVHEV